MRRWYFILVAIAVLFAFASCNAPDDIDTGIYNDVNRYIEENSFEKGLYFAHVQAYSGGIEGENTVIQIPAVAALNPSDNSNEVTVFGAADL